MASSHMGTGEETLMADRRKETSSFGPSCVPTSWLSCLTLGAAASRDGKDLVGDQPTIWDICLQGMAVSRLTNPIIPPKALTLLDSSPASIPVWVRAPQNTEWRLSSQHSLHLPPQAHSHARGLCLSNDTTFKSIVT